VPAWLDQVLGDPPAKPTIPAWLQKAFAADATATKPRPQLPQPTIGPLAVQNQRPGGTAIPRPQPALPVDDQGVFGSGQGQGLFDVLPGLGAARGVKAGVDIAKAGHLPLGLLVGAISALPEGGALAGKLGGAVAREAEEKIGPAVIRYMGKEYDGPIHAVAIEKAREEAEGRGLPFLWSAVDDNYFRTSSGRVVDRTEAKKIAQAAGQRPDKIRGGAGREGHLFSEALPERRELLPMYDPKETRSVGRQMLDAEDDKRAGEIADRATAGGFTFDPRARSFVESGGYMVGGVPGQQGMVVDEITPATIKEFRAKNAKLLARDGMMIGGWRDGATGKFYLDVSQRVPDRDAALELLKDRGEKAAWHLDKGEELVNPHATEAVSAGSAPAGLTPKLVSDEEIGLGGRRAVYDVGGEPLHVIYSQDQGPGELYLESIQTPDGHRVELGAAGARRLYRDLVSRTGADKIIAERLTGANPGRFVEWDARRLAGLPASKPTAPAVIVPERWKPTERGVFDRSAPKIQGTAAVDPRLAASMPRGQVSPIADAIANSKTVRQGLEKDAIAGLPFGGDQWYETGPIKASYESSNGPMTFRDWLNASGSGSIQNPTHNEPASASILLYAKRHGISVDEAMAEFRRQFPDAATPWMSQGIAANFARADELGGQFPSTPGAGERKVPWYTHGKEGGSLEGEAALDTHERRRLVQLAGENPRLRKMLRELGVTNIEGPKADVVPIKNALDYAALSAPYRRVAENLGLPSTQAAQAGRWLGGGQHTGLASQPFGDYVQTLEDGLLYTARSRGLDESPAGLRSLWDRISQGEDFFMPLYSRKGGYPVY